jgi:hypothetical protein
MYYVCTVLEHFIDDKKVTASYHPIKEPDIVYQRICSNKKLAYFSFILDI